MMTGALPKTNAATPVGSDDRLAAAFGKRVARWALEQGASPAVRQVVQRAAQLVSKATSNGHSCLALDELAESLEGAGEPRLYAAALRTLLLDSRVVGTAEAPASLPLILDDERLYLHRYFDYECRLAATLASRSSERTNSDTHTLPPSVFALLDELFPDDAAQPGTPDWQKIAVSTALRGRLTIISGGPGTGKTTTVVNLLACLLEANPDCRIALTAPTGKAAARMTEVIHQRAGHLPEALRARLPTESSTIHRLLGSTGTGEFRHHAGNPLPIDALVVDEASMLDLALAVHLIEAVPTDARIILLGDKDQLSAVESGAVFAELSAERTAGLHDQVIELRRSYRFDAGSTIGLLATDIKNGNSAAALARLGPPQGSERSSDRSLLWINDGGAVPSKESNRAIVEGYELYIESVRRHEADPQAVTAAFARFRVLCALRDGPWGVNAINREVGTHFRRTLKHPRDPGLRSEWYSGRPVMVLRNDPVLKLFNGDIGIVLADEDGELHVHFPAEAGAFRAIAPARLPEHETAFAMTVHKSQGSEFDEVLLVLPAEQSRVLTRELLYTAVTRARERLTIVGNAGVVAAAVETATKRVSGLAGRVRNLMALTEAKGAAPATASAHIAKTFPRKRPVDK
jgi:exodeoxyribonuclease V alpha subunit